MQILGQRIRELRERKDLSVREFAKQIDVSAPFLSDVELGRRYPSEEVLKTIAKVLGTSLEDLKVYDSRPPVEELKRLSTSNPAMGFALRKMVDSKVSPEDLMEFLKNHKGPKTK